MSDINFGKVLKGVAKGAAKLASSYMAESAKTLSHNSHLTEEARDQYAELSDSFSDFRDRLDQSDRTEDDSEDSSFSFYDVHDSFAGTANDVNDSFSNTACGSLSAEPKTSSYPSQHSQFNSIQNNTYTAPHILKQMTFAGMQWYILNRDEDRQRAILLSKDIIKLMPFSNAGISKFEDSSLYKWLNHDFRSELTGKLKPKDLKRLVSISLLNSKDIEVYLPKGKSRVVLHCNMPTEWWLSDSKRDLVKAVSSTGAIEMKKGNEKYGVRPVIVIKLKEKGQRI